MQINKQYSLLKAYILEPVFKRFEIPEMYHKYFTAYYIEGVSAIIKEWLVSDCSDSVDSVAQVIEECVRPSDYRRVKEHGK